MNTLIALLILIFLSGGHTYKLIKDNRGYSHSDIYNLKTKGAQPDKSDDDDFVFKEEELYSEEEDD